MIQKQRMYSYVQLILVLSLLIGLTGCGEQVEIDDLTLAAVKTDTSISLDGQANEDVWTDAAPILVTVDNTPYRPSNGYEGLTSTEVVIKSVYTEDKIYFLVEWDDPTMSLERFPWEKQADGTWKQLTNKDDTGHDNTYYEDKFAMYWNISTEDFDNKGCFASCHLNADDLSAGRKYTPGEGQTIDMWHWKSVRSGPVGQFDDQFVDSTTDPSENKNWGRKGDTKTGGGYTNNIDSETGLPKWQDPVSGTVVDNKYWILDEEKVPFVDTYNAGDQIAGIIVSAFEGPRGDIFVTSNYYNGKWTLEIERNLVTTGENSDTQDVQFSDLGDTYNFGVSVFDNSQINHVYNADVLKLIFLK